ncbi:flavin-containing monooxygenase 5-like [Patiria miniata]|uniref:Flavin-containing monooxygenase n=1 Tax=Patiria miniata TaxID=46514 RepID=A0A914AVG9_PATMI|nr:flavin-containing monooxygenase 5-like [Patiria miniata]
MEITSKTVAIIGCGVSGLAAVKCCLDEGLQPTCFERADDIGGLWYYRDNSEHQVMTTVYKSTITTSAKEGMCYSDFPFPKEWPNILRHSYVKKYCDMYADKFGLNEHIRFSTRVTRLAQAPDYETTGRWVVTTQPEGSAGSQETNQEFDAVMICTGMFNNPHIPDFPGLDVFQGKVIHSQAYRTPDEYKDKRVVVVGIGNSGGDAATDVSRLATQVYLSCRRGVWLTGGGGDYGYPFDLEVIRRYYWVPFKLKMMLLKKSIERRNKLAMASLQPSHGLLACEPQMSEQLPNCIMNGSVVIRAGPARFTKTGLEFEDGTFEDDIEAVIMATGYRFKISFEVDCPALEMKDDSVPLYKLVFPLGLKHNTLSFSGAMEVLGAVIPCVELQARWAARVFKGLAKLPSQLEMQAEVTMTDEMMKKSFLPPHRHVGAVAYGDSIATEIGARPNFLKLFFTHPVLTLRCLFGPHVPYVYRLTGPGKTEEAKKAINTVWERIVAPTMTRRVETKRPPSPLALKLICPSIIASVIAILIVQFW